MAKFQFSILLMVLLTAGSACARRNEPSTEQLYQQAVLDLRRGNLSAAQSAARKGVSQWQGKLESEWYWKYRLLEAEALVNQGRSKEGLELLETEPAHSTGFYLLECRIKAVRVKALLRLGRTDEVRSLLDEAESLASKTNQPSVQPEIDALRGLWFDALRRPADAESAFQSGLKHAEEQNDAYWRTIILNNLGMNRVRQFRYDEALPFLTHAQEGFEKMDAALNNSVALGNIGLCAGKLGDFDKASAAYRKAIEVQERAGAKPYLQASLGELGNLYSLQDDFAKAIPYYQRALDLAAEVNATSDASKWARNLADAFANVSKWDEAEKFNQRSQELKAQIKDSESQIYTRLNAATIARGRGQSNIAVDLYEQMIKDAAKNSGVLWEAHAGLAKLYQDAGQVQKASQHFEAAIHTIEASRSELTQADYRITFLSRLIKFYEDYVDALIGQNAVDRALEVVESSRARVLAERFGGGRTEQATPSIRNYVEAARRSGVTFMSYWLAPRRSFLWVITPKERKVFVLPPRQEIESLVDSYRAAIEGLRDPLEAPPPAAGRLYDTLLAQARPLLSPSARVVIVPDGALHNLNFETLPAPGQKPHYWIEDAIVSIAPSMNVEPRAPSPALKSLLLIGDPESSGEYPKLPYARNEVHNVEERLAGLEQTVYEGPRAEPTVYENANPGKYSIIHFAAHATANRESPLDSAIILSPSNNSFKLYARDVMKTALQADLVTISACRGAGARVYSGEGLVGFSWAFLQTGARNVIAGLWDVTDRSTAQLMDRLYAELRAGKSPAEALREAKLAMIHSNTNFAKPYYWGPFQVYIGRK